MNFIGIALLAALAAAVGARAEYGHPALPGRPEQESPVDAIMHPVVASHLNTFKCQAWADLIEGNVHVHPDDIYCTPRCLLSMYEQAVDEGHVGPDVSLSELQIQLDLACPRNGPLSASHRFNNKRDSKN